ncbi:MAG TPA: CesT family type III secretion system chaperone [Ramlibacter sp.]|nr:CesT family type III secretion system chaperone [Ramlibacter sp.]
MAITSFHQLCADLCEVCGVPAPELAPDESGLLGMTLTLHEVDVCLHHAPLAATPAVHVSVEFGVVPAAVELQALRELLDTNLMLHGVNAPAFARNPTSGDVLLQYAVSLDRATVAGLFESINALVLMAQQWREDYFLSSEDAQPDATSPAASVHGAYA